MNLQKLKDAISSINAFIADVEGSQNEDNRSKFERNPLPSDAKPAYDACRGLWEAAQKARMFDIFQYIPGIQPLASHIREQRPADQMNADIIKLGFTAWGQEWLSDDRNAALIDPDYQRHFIGYRVVRKNQNDESQGYNRVP